MPRKSRRQTKTAAKEEKRSNAPDKKKQQDLRKALFLATRAKKKSDRTSDDSVSPTKSIKTVSPEKEVRQDSVTGNSPRVSNRIKALKARHEQELLELSALEKQANDALQEINDIKDSNEPTSDAESKSVVNITDDSDKDMELSSVDDQDLDEYDTHEDDQHDTHDDEKSSDEKDEESQGIIEDETSTNEMEIDKVDEETDDDKDSLLPDDENKDDKATNNDSSHTDNTAHSDAEESTDTPVRGSNRFAILSEENDTETKSSTQAKETAKKDAYDRYNKQQRSKSKKTSNAVSASTFLDGYKNPPYKHVLFCKLKAPIPLSETPTKTLHDAFSIVIQMLRQADPSCVIFKFKDDTSRRHITLSSQIPQVLSKMKEYFDGTYRPSTQAATVWCEMKIGFNVEKETMFDDIKYLLKEHGDFAFYEKALQYRKVVCFGYLLFSTWTMDRQRVIDSITLCCEREFNRDIIINAVWRKISDPFNGTRRWNKSSKDKAKLQTLSNDEDVKALHLECEAGKEEDYSAMIAKLYSTQRTTAPCGEAMRFVGYSTRYQNTDFIRKLNTLRNRQAWFTASIGTMRTYEIVELDYKASKLKRTMRRLLMEMLTTDDKRMFWTVDEAWNKDGIVITFPLKHSEEARNRVADLGPYIFHFEGEKTIKKYFTPSAAERALASTWDATNNRAISQEEEAMDELLACIDNDMSFMGDPTRSTEVDTTQMQNDTATQKLRPTRLFNYDPHDDESLGTFGQQSLSDRQQVLNLAVQQNNIETAASRNDMAEGDDLTHDGEMTVDTLSSRMSVLENNLSIMANGMNTLIGHLHRQNVIKDAPDDDQDSSHASESENKDNLDKHQDNGDSIGDNKQKTTRPSAGNATSSDTGSHPAGSSKGPAGGP